MTHNRQATIGDVVKIAKDARKHGTHEFVVKEDGTDLLLRIKTREIQYLSMGQRVNFTHGVRLLEEYQEPRLL
jgi:hypothetical protein